MRGRWAAGIRPRNFCWIVTDHLAVSERPGGYAPNHRKVRRHEELLWLRAQGFTRIVSLLGSTHNLHAYDELGLEWSRYAMPAGAETHEVLADLYPALFAWLRSGERVLLHQEELGDRLMGVVAGYLLWSGLLPDGPQAITATERLLKRQMGSAGRIIVAATADLDPAPVVADEHPPHPPAAAVPLHPAPVVKATPAQSPAPKHAPAATSAKAAPPAKAPPAKAPPAKAPPAKAPPSKAPVPAAKAAPARTPAKAPIPAKAPVPAKAPAPPRAPAAKAATSKVAAKRAAPTKPAVKTAPPKVAAGTATKVKAAAPAASKATRSARS